MALVSGNLEQRRLRPARPGRQAWGARASSAIATGCQVVLLGMVSVAPWLFGAVLSSAQFWLVVGAAIVACGWALVSLLDRSRSTALPWAALPLVCGIGLGAIQLLPLDAQVVSRLSPAAAQLRGELLGNPGPDASSAEKAAGAPAREPLSLYPASTRRELAMLLLALGLLAGGVVFFRTPGAQMGLCVAVAAGGALLAFFDLAQQLTGSGMMVWRRDWASAGGVFGPFVNRNNAGGFLNLSLAAALAMTVWAVGRRSASRGATEAVSPDGLRASLAAILARVDGMTIAAFGLTACIVAGVLCSMSRGAGVAMFAAAVVTLCVVLSARRRSLRLWSIGLAIVAGLGLVGWVGMTESVQARFGTLLDQKVLLENRLPHWRDGLAAAGRFWLTGSGLGTYRYVYPLDQQRFDSNWYYHAENQSLEGLVEGGIAATALTVVMTGAVALACWRMLRRGAGLRALAFAVAGIFALASQVVHSCFDFGLCIPANMMLFALVCGAALGGAAEASPAAVPVPSAVTFRRRRVAIATSVALLAGLIWAGREIDAVAGVDKAMRDTVVLGSGGASPRWIRAGIAELETALARRNDDAEAHWRAASLWIELYRAEAVEQLCREQALGSDKARLRAITGTWALHRRANEFLRNGQKSDLNRLRDEPIVRNRLPHAVAEAILAREACPLLPGPHLILAELAFLEGDPAGGAADLSRVRRVAPGDVELAFHSGLLEYQCGRMAQACQDWRRSLTLHARRLAEILSLAGERMSLAYIVEKVLPESPAFLVQVARTHYAGAQQGYMRRLLAVQAERLLGRAALPEEERHYLRGAVLALQESYGEAIPEYVRAVQLRPRQLEWRYELAGLLKQQGLLAPAREHARFCVLMEPADGRYRHLLEQIHRTRLTTNASSR